MLHVAQKSEADTFLDLLAIMEGSPVLNRPPAIPLDRLLREKALDLYRFIERVVKNHDRQKISRRVALGDQEEKILEIVKGESIDLVVLPVRKQSFFPHLMGRGNLLKIISRLPCPVLLKPPYFEPWPQSGMIQPGLSLGNRGLDGQVVMHACHVG